MTTFTPLDWAHHTNIYEVNLRQYTVEGNFNAFKTHLPRLRDMGVHTLWLMPITPISQKNKKGTLGSYYACSSYTQTSTEFGTLDNFKALVQEAHQLGFKLIIDWVANHTGWDHEWTAQHPDFYTKDAAGNFVPPVENWEDVIKLDFNNTHMRQAMIDAMVFWVKECDIDGFRCDMAHLVPLDFWIDARTQLDAHKKLFWLAECEEPSYHPAFDASYTWNWMHHSAQLYKEQTSLQDLRNVLTQYQQNFPPSALRVFFTSNHDENSWNGTEYEKYGDAAKAMAVFSCTYNGIPMLYSGQEMPNYKRLKFFDKDPIEWTGQYQLQDFYSALLHLHSTHPALKASVEEGSTSFLNTDAPNFILAYLRKNGDSEVLVILNLSKEDKPLVTIKDEKLWGVFYNFFSQIERDFTEKKYFALRPWEYQIYVKAENRR
jgi:alpha-amylase